MSTKVVHQLIAQTILKRDYPKLQLMMKQVTATLVLALGLILKCSNTSAEGIEKMSLSLKQAQDYAMQYSLTVKDGLYDLEAAKKRIWESTAIGLPQASTSLSYSYNLQTPPKISFPAGKDSVVNIPAGTKSTTTITTTVSQLIFSGSYIVGLQAAKSYKEMVAQSLEKTKIDIREAVTQSYYLILLTNETHHVLLENLNNLNKTLYETEKMQEKGFADATSVDQLKISVNDLQISISTVLRQEQVARRLLNYQLGIDLNSEISLTDNLENIVLGINKERILETPFDFTKNINYNMAETQIRVKKLLYRLEVSSYLPTISGFYQNYKLVNKSAFSFQPENLVGLSVNLPLFSSGQRYSKAGQARIALNKAELAKQMAERALNMEYLQTRDDFNTAWEKYLNSKSSMDLAQKVLKEVTIKFKNGMATSTELTQANDKLLQTIGNLYSTEYDLLNAKLHLDKVTSNL